MHRNPPKSGLGSGLSLLPFFLIGDKLSGAFFVFIPLFLVLLLIHLLKYYYILLYYVFC